MIEPADNGKPRQCAARPAMFEAFYRVVRNVECGRVATYGQVAAAAGYPRHARHVGRALAALSADSVDVPWHRVINARGRISPRGLDGSDELQRQLLDSEGIEFGIDGSIDLRRFGWDPGASAARRRDSQQ